MKLPMASSPRLPGASKWRPYVGHHRLGDVDKVFVEEAENHVGERVQASGAGGLLRGLEVHGPESGEELANGLVKIPAAETAQRVWVKPSVVTLVGGHVGGCMRTYLQRVSYS